MTKKYPILKKLKGEAGELSIKRFYTGYSMKDKCPKCGSICEGLDGDYLSYPSLDKPENVHFGCWPCIDGEGTEWAQKVRVKVVLELP